MSRRTVWVKLERAYTPYLKQHRDEVTIPMRVAIHNIERFEPNGEPGRNPVRKYTDVYFVHTDRVCVNGSVEDIEAAIEAAELMNEQRESP